MQLQGKCTLVLTDEEKVMSTRPLLFARKIYFMSDKIKRGSKERSANFCSLNCYHFIKRLLYHNFKCLEY